MSEPLLEVEDLTMRYTTREGEVSAVEGVSFTLDRGESLGLVGESGCGKTSIALTLLKLLPDNGRITGGHVFFKGVDLVPLNEEGMRAYRWKGISMVFQAAMNSLNPVYRVGDQVVEAILAHENISVAQARERTATLFELVELDPSLMNSYPHEYSGGMKQRAVIAMALAANPDLIIADEPTTALDVIIQDRILRMLREIQQRLSMSMIYISHDIAAIAEVSDKIGVMYGGKLVEMADTVSLFQRPLHPYSQALMASFPSIRGPKRALEPLPGEPPHLVHPPPGCRFHPRCPRATAICQGEEPLLEPTGQPIEAVAKGAVPLPAEAPPSPGDSDPPLKNEALQRLVACWHPLLEPEEASRG